MHRGVFWRASEEASGYRAVRCEGTSGEARGQRLPPTGRRRTASLRHVQGREVWRLRFDWQGKEQTLALGTYPAVGLADARSRRDVAKKRLAAGEDPREASPAETGPTLSEVIERWHAINKPRWAPHHATDVLNKIKVEILTAIGAKPMQAVTAPDLLTELRKVETRSVETAHRLRGYLDQWPEFDDRMAAVEAIGAGAPFSFLFATFRDAALFCQRMYLGEGPTVEERLESTAP